MKGHTQRRSRGIHPQAAAVILLQEFQRPAAGGPAVDPASELHGVEYEIRRTISAAPMQNDVAGILNPVLRGPAGRLHRIREWFEREVMRKSRRGLEKPFRSADCGLALSERVIPTQERPEVLGRVKTGDAWCRQWLNFLGGQWLEHLVGERVRELMPEADVAARLNARRGPAVARVEVGVGLARGSRSYFI